MKRMALMGLMMLLWLIGCAAADNNEPAPSNSDKPVITVYKSAS